MDIDGDTDTADVGLFNSGYGTSTCANPAPLTAAQFARADFDGDCDIDLSDLGVFYSHNGAAAGNYAKFTWGAENRLIEVKPLPRSRTTVTIPAAYRKVDFGYDFRGRRVEKRVYQRDSGYTA